MSTNTMNVNDVVDNAKFTKSHLSIMLWCLILILFDGYDLAINGVALPLLMKEWGLRNGKNVGEMVFLLIEEDVFSKQPEDSLDDFKGFMSFRKAFEEPYEFQDQPS